MGLDTNLQGRDLAIGFEERDSECGRELLVEECNFGGWDKPEFL